MRTAWFLGSVCRVSWVTVGIFACACGSDGMTSGDGGTTGTGTAQGETGDDCPPGTPPGLAADVEPVFARYCVAGCHTPSGTWPTVDLSAGNAFGSLVGVDGTQPLVPDPPVLVEPFSTEQSYLWAKINASQQSLWESDTRPMPYGCTVGEAAQSACPPGVPSYDRDQPNDRIVDALTQQEFTTIENWILCGARP